MTANEINKDTTGKDDESHEATNKGPLWSDESESRRVRATIWSHAQKGGKVRHTVGLCRSYFDKESQEWVNTHYFDRKDLDDVIELAQVARKKLDRIVDGVPEEPAAS